MTQHIEEAVERLKLLRKVGFGYDIKDEDRAAIDAVLSALAAAEERGRIEERERCAMEDGAGVETLTHEMRERMISEMNGLIEFLTENPDNIYHLDADKVQLLRAAITKEPTP